MRYIILCVTLTGLGLLRPTKAAPGGVGFIAAASSNVKPPIVFDGGNVGVNFGGYSASAGLGGLLSGGAGQGGLHAEAGTPFGQSAGAGLGGVLAAGETAGGLHASADSGAGASAAAKIVGSVATATSDDAYVSKVVEHHASPVVIEKTVQGAPTVQKTYVERTIIPNYVEKTVQVPSYVEKTIRVPTVIEKRIRVEAAPTIIEKKVDVPIEHETVAVNSGATVENVGTVKVFERTGPVYRKHWVGGFGGGYGSGFLGGLFGGGGFNGGTFSHGGGGGGGGTYTYRKSVDSGFVNDVFNIPISTLSAVNKLVGGIVGGGGGGGGSFSVSKHFSTY